MIRLYDPEFLKIFLNAPIPGLARLSIYNAKGINYDYRSLLLSTDNQLSLNVFETLEYRAYELHSDHITLFDILMTIMQVKSSKLDFAYERVVGVTSFDPIQQVLVLSIEHEDY